MALLLFSSWSCVRRPPVSRSTWSNKLSSYSILIQDTVSLIIEQVCIILFRSIRQCCSCKELYRKIVFSLISNRFSILFTDHLYLRFKTTHIYLFCETKIDRSNSLAKFSMNWYPISQDLLRRHRSSSLTRYANRYHQHAKDGFVYWPVNNTNKKPKSKDSRFYVHRNYVSLLILWSLRIKNSFIFLPKQRSHELINKQLVNP